MKLKEYIAKVTRVVTHHPNERDILEKIAEGDGRKNPEQVKDEYDRAIGFVKEALAANKNLLGIFQEEEIISTGKIEKPSKDELLERDIEKRDLQRNILKFRHDLRGHAPKMREEEDPDKNRETCDRIIFRIVTEINDTLGGNTFGFGGVFSDTEEMSYKTEFKTTVPAPYLPHDRRPGVQEETHGHRQKKSR